MQIIFTHLYTKYSCLIQIICTEFFGFKYSYLIPLFIRFSSNYFCFIIIIYLKKVQFPDKVVCAFLHANAHLGNGTYPCLLSLPATMGKIVGQTRIFCFLKPAYRGEKKILKTWRELFCESLVTWCSIFLRSDSPPKCG